MIKKIQKMYASSIVTPHKGKNTTASNSYRKNLGKLPPSMEDAIPRFSIVIASAVIDVILKKKSIGYSFSLLKSAKASATAAAF